MRAIKSVVNRRRAIGIRATMVSSPSSRRKMMNTAQDDGMPELKSRTRAQAKQQSFNSESRAMKSKLAATQPTAMPKAVWFVAFALAMGGLYMYHAFTNGAA